MILGGVLLFLVVAVGLAIVAWREGRDEK